MKGKLRNHIPTLRASGKQQLYADIHRAFEAGSYPNSALAQFYLGNEGVECFGFGQPHSVDGGYEW